MFHLWFWQRPCGSRRRGIEHQTRDVGQRLIAAERQFRQLDRRQVIAVLIDKHLGQVNRRRLRELFVFADGKHVVQAHQVLVGRVGGFAKRQQVNVGRQRGLQRRERCSILGLLNCVFKREHTQANVSTTKREITLKFATDEPAASGFANA